MQQDYELRNAAMPHHLRRKTLIWYAMICYPSSKPLNPQLLTGPPSFPPTLELFSPTSKSKQILPQFTRISQHSCSLIRLPKANRSPSIHQDIPTSFNSHPLRLPLLPTKRIPISLSLSLSLSNEMAECPQSFYSVNPLLGPLPTCATNSIPPKAHLHFLSFSLAIRQWGVTTTPEK